MIENIIISFGVGSVASGLIFLVTRSFITEKLKNSIKHEYDIRLENHRSLIKSELDKQIELYKSEVRKEESVGQSKWEIKRNACLKALDIIDGFWSNHEWKGRDSNGKEIDNSIFEKQALPSIEDIRSCYNSLALSCENEKILRKYKKCLNLYEDIKGDDIVDLRNAIRRELGFGADVDSDRDIAFFGRVNKLESKILKKGK